MRKIPKNIRKTIDFKVGSVIVRSSNKTTPKTEVINVENLTRQELENLAETLADYIVGIAEIDGLEIVLEKAGMGEKELKAVGYAE